MSSAVTVTSRTSNFITIGSRPAVTPARRSLFFGASALSIACSASATCCQEQLSRLVPENLFDPPHCRMFSVLDLDPMCAGAGAAGAILVHRYQALKAKQPNKQACRNRSGPISPRSDARMRHRHRDRPDAAIDQRLQLTIRTCGETLGDLGRQDARSRYRSRSPAAHPAAANLARSPSSPRQRRGCWSTMPRACSRLGADDFAPKTTSTHIADGAQALGTIWHPFSPQAHR